jgi:hypothetical protein
LDIVLIRDLGGQTAQFFQHAMDLGVGLDALRLVQLHRDAGQATIGPPRYRCYNFQIATQFHHGRRGRCRFMLPLRLQK